MMMKTFKQNIIAMYGVAGQQWLDQLPSITEGLANTYGLSDLEPVSNMTFNYVLAGHQQQTPIVLKLGLNSKAIFKEGECLRAFSDHGAVKLLAASDGMLLMERAVPGVSLKSYFPKKDHLATSVVCELMQKLHAVALPSQHHYYHIQDLLTCLDEEVDIPAKTVSKARQLRDQLLSSTTNDVLLHGDLHHDNILQQGDRWVAIDPKGFVGDPVFELAAFLSNPMPDVLAVLNVMDLVERRIQQCAKQLNMPAQRIRDWHYVKSVLCWVWSLQDGVSASDWEQWVMMLSPSL